jgi:hypothetical protein
MPYELRVFSVQKSDPVRSYIILSATVPDLVFHVNVVHTECNLPGEPEDIVSVTMGRLPGNAGSYYGTLIPEYHQIFRDQEGTFGLEPQAFLDRVRPTLEGLAENREALWVLAA